ncbi:hypothetical protein NMS_1112 [Nonlabens marinus S1-08]|uniref:Uncharacterized protein n=1 Tax=Nonlabens marinus S1-08 TaxID=1454201 RepID=W8VZT2_9FLAO|nr:hypothetical protein NMS_1112 [Nonlabens marinus S1-08]
MYGCKDDEIVFAFAKANSSQTALNSNPFSKPKSNTFTRILQTT